ncbi:MAG: V4R domain-containing protein, partial [Anaerotignum sp.]
TGETVCNYDEGFLAGILKEYTKKEYVVTEIDCWATGSRVCRFSALCKENMAHVNER